MMMLGDVLGFSSGALIACDGSSAEGFFSGMMRYLAAASLTLVMKPASLNTQTKLSPGRRDSDTKKNTQSWSRGCVARARTISYI